MASIEEMVRKLEKRIEKIEILLQIVPDPSNCVCTKITKIESEITKNIESALIK